MPRRCVMRKCKSYGDKINKSLGITYHTFPTNDLRKNKWVRIVRTERSEPDWIPSSRCTICSAHFKKEDFYTTLKGSYTRLKRTAVPVIAQISS